MYAVVANGIQTVCSTPRQLETIISIYPYPKFRKCSTEEEARAWLRRNSRAINALSFTQYGETSRYGFISVEYFIVDGNAYYNLDTSRFGKIKIRSSEGIMVDNRSDLVKVKVEDTKLDNNLIVHHIIAIRRILKIIGDFADVDIKLPDISVYLAAAKYHGKNYIIKGLQKDIARRLGGVSFSVKEY